MSEAYSRRLQLEKLVQGAASRTKEALKVQAEKRKNRRAEFSPKRVGRGEVRKLEQLWREANAACFPFFQPDRWWTQIEDTEKGKPTKEAGLVGQLVKMYPLSQVRAYLTWGVTRWAEVAALLPGKPIPASPSIQVLFTFRETLLPVALGAA